MSHADPTEGPFGCRGLLPQASGDPEPWDPTRLRPITGDRLERTAFFGRPAEALDRRVGETVDHIFKQGGQNPIKYVNCG